tara:strand:- start:189 stop:536 length:348 start_codon:yes stop_codon:yes gene_type:complete
MRILIAGGRDFGDYDLLYNTLRPYSETALTVISGTAKGADTLGEHWALDYGVAVERYPALWEEHGRAAGHIRNQLMLDDGKPDLVVVFPGGKGSISMVQKARKAGVETITPGWTV